MCTLCNMITMLAARDLLDAVHLAELFEAQHPGVRERGRGVAWDSRRVRPGDVFFALPGAAGHGVSHAPEALERGAALIVSDRPAAVDSDRIMLVDDAQSALTTLGAAAREALHSPVVAITGSAGKTTTKGMVTAVLDGRATPGNLNTVPALVAALVQAALQDSGAQDSGAQDSGAQDRTHAGSVDDEESYLYNGGALTGTGGARSPVVLELGIDRPGEMAELLAFCRPDHGLVTTIGESHLAALGDVAGVAREKSLLLAEVPGVRMAGSGAVALLPPEVAARTDVITATYEQGGNLRFEGHELELPWPGRALAENALLALSLAVRLGVDFESAYRRLLAVDFESGRLRQVVAGDLLLIDDSYNANPLSMTLALEVLRGLPAPHVAILGDMRELGAVSRRRHLELGTATADLALVIAVGQEAAAITETNPAALRAGDAAEARTLLDRIPAGATVLVKGSRSLGLERLVAALEAGR